MEGMHDSNEDSKYRSSNPNTISLQTEPGGTYSCMHTRPTRQTTTVGCWLPEICNPVDMFEKSSARSRWLTDSRITSAR